MFMNRKISSILAGSLISLMLAPAAVFAEDPLDVQVPVEIVLEGPVLDSEDTFTVELAAETKNAPMPEGAEGSVYTTDIEGAGTAVLEMNYPNLGVYSYTVKQIAEENDYLVYDETEYKLTVYVTGDENFNPGVTTVLENPDGEKVDEAVFTNEYLPPEPAKLDPPVEKLVTNIRGTAPADSEFIFAMIPGEKDYPMPDNKEAETDEATGAMYMTQKGPGSYEFGWMTFDVDDVGKTYTYTLREMPGKDAGYTYDTKMYTLTVVVTSVDRKITLDVTYQDETGKDAEKAVFNNKYDAGEPEKPAQPGKPSTGPSTGDATNMTLWIVIICAAAAAAIISAVVVKRRRKEQ